MTRYQRYRLRMLDDKERGGSTLTLQERLELNELRLMSVKMRVAPPENKMQAEPGEDK